MRIIAILLLGVTLGAAPLVAQGRGGMGGGGMRGGGGGRPMMGGRRPVDAPSGDLVRGPFVPDSMIPKFGLDSAQGARYRAAWDSMMAATAVTRDSAQAAMAGIRRARMEGFQHEGTRLDDVMEKLGKELKKDEEHFDKVVKRILTKDQWGDFKDWRDRRRETERELREQDRRDGPEGGSTGRRPRN